MFDMDFLVQNFIIWIGLVRKIDDVCGTLSSMLKFADNNLFFLPGIFAKRVGWMIAINFFESFIVFRFGYITQHLYFLRFFFLVDLSLCNMLIEWNKFSFLWWNIVDWSTNINIYRKLRESSSPKVMLDLVFLPRLFRNHYPFALFLLYNV